MICPVCLEETTLENPMSKDHIIPKWFVNRLVAFTGDKKVSWQKLKKARGETVVNVRRICRNCNNTKGPNLDFTDPVTRELAEMVIDNLTKKLKEHDIHSLKSEDNK